MAKKNEKLVLFIKIFTATIVVHWIIILLGYILLTAVGADNAYGGFFSFFYEKFSVSGDVPHYIEIAKNGYASSGDTANLIVFYPLYPTLMKIFALIFRDYFISGVIVSNICLGISGYYLYRLAYRELGEDKAKDSFAIYLLYPMGAFMVQPFTESLFMMLTLMCLYYIREKKWLACGIAGLFAALSRSQGIALLVPAVYEAVMYMVRNKKFIIKSLSVFLIPAGTVIYLCINKIVQGDFLAFVEHEAAEPWYNVSHWISDNLAQHYNAALDYFSLGIIIYWAQLILYFVGILALFYGLRKKVAASIVAYGGAYMFLSYLHGWLISGPRYMMGCVALYIIYGAVDNKIVKHIILLACGIFAVFVTLCMWRGEAIM